MKHLLFILFATLTLSTYPQTKWAPAGAEWYYTYSTAGSNPLADYEKFEIIKDTVVDDKLCKIIGSNFSSEIMYEEDSKVFYRFKDGFRLIYDFTAKVGDTIEFELKSYSPNSFVIDTTYNAYCVVTNIEPEVIDDTEVKKFYTTVLKNDDLNHVIWPTYYNYQERIGYEEGFVQIISIPTTTDSQHTLRCYQDSDIHYSTDWWKLKDKPCDYKYISHANQVSTVELNIFPNPAKNQITISNPFNIQIKKIELFDFSGRIVQLWNANECAGKTLNIQHISPGVYLLKAETDAGVQTEKLVVQ